MSRQSASTWHLDEATLQAYVDGHPLSVVGASVEAHLVGCPECRVRLGELMPHQAVDRAWSAIRAHVEAPRRSLPERLIRWSGISTETARLLVAVPAFRGAWLLGLFTVTLFAGLAALFAGKYGMTLFLIVAPLAPVAGVAASFGGDADPCHELVTVTPHSAVRVLLLRTAGVLATSLPITLLAGLALPGPAWVGVAWLTPAIAGVALTLLLAPVFGSTVAAATLAALWSAAVVFASRLNDPIDVVEPTMQLVFTALTLIAVVALVVRQPSFERLGKAVMNTVTLTGLDKSYGRTKALSGVDLVLAPGVTGLLGPNGAGKTTMLRILATALAADRGSLRILGQDPTTTDGRVAVRQRLGYVPQETGFPRGFTTFAFVDYMAILKEWSDLPSRHAEVRRVVGQVGLADVATKRVSALSGGQRRRVVLAQALLGRPDLLVLDEPTAGLDPAQRGRLRDVLGRAGETSTVVISTHQTEDVAALCERVVVLDGGRILFDGTVTEMVSQAAGRVWMAAERHPAAHHAWRTGSGRFRNVGDPPPSAELIEPALEDAYLLLVGDAAGATEMEAAS